MSKLHELLAVDTQVKGQADSARKDLMNTFEKKRHSHFSRKTITFRSNREGVEPRVEAHQDLQTTVRKELKWVGEKLAKAMDIGHQVDIGNTTAKADVSLENGTILLKSVPTTSLLQMAHRLKELQDFVTAIPTLDPAQGFTVDGSMSTDGDTVYKAIDVDKPRTEKVQEPLVLYPATDKHPAQVQVVSKDILTGTVLTQEWSGLLTTAEKGNMLDRVEEVTRAVKAARARANELELDVKSNKIGDRVLNYVFYNKVA